MKLYFSGIGGSGLGPLAHLALDAGYKVTGSDAESGLFIQQLLERGVEICIGQSMDEITANYDKEPFDWLVITSALPPTHPHIIFAAQKGIRISKRDEVINEIITTKKLKLIAIAGTHGKTTSTAMAVWCMKQLKVPVSYSIGSNIGFGRSAQYQEGSEYFLYEADEFDRNMLHFEPFGTIITSLEYDHQDTYPTVGEYYQAFADFLSQTSHSVVCWKSAHDALKEYLPMKSYVINPKPFIADANLIDPSTQAVMTTIGLVGEHNRHNAFLVLTMILSLVESDLDEIIAALASFPGSQRRFEKLTPSLISDYAHHPAEIQATIQMAREYMESVDNHNQLIIVYQPHQNIRQYEPLIQEGYKTCFGEADKVFWLPTYLSRENDLPILTPEYLSSCVAGPKTELVSLDGDLQTKIHTHIERGDLVLCLGAGSIDKWLRDNFENSQSNQKPDISEPAKTFPKSAV